MSPNPSSVNAGGLKLALGLAVCGLVAVLAQGGCAESTPVEFVLVPDGGARGPTNDNGPSASGTGGSDATGGTVGSGGQTSSGGSPGTGGNSASGGAPGTGGVTATGGVTGTGGARATGGTTGAGGGRATGGATGGGGAMGGGGSAAPTFTQVYQTILSVSCSGSQCHNPGTKSGISFA
ncbi:MAG: hypothetical protein ABUS79_27965, partial [Pseudomonadota bacterium]